MCVCVLECIRQCVCICVCVSMCVSGSVCACRGTGSRNGVEGRGLGLRVEVEGWG